MGVRIAATALGLVLLCSCSAANLPVAGVNDLLKTPTLNRMQAEIYEALEATLYLPDIVYRYPQQGENRTPFIFYDLSGDGRDEAIVFYSFASRTSEIRAKILCRDDDGKWYSFSDVPGQGDQVDFVDFASIASADRPSMLIGWQDTARREYHLEIFSMNDEAFVKEAQHKYAAFSIADYGGNELSQIVLVSRENRGLPYEVRLIGSHNGQVRQVAAVTLFEDVESILQMKQGRLWDGSIAVFIDELLDNETVATEIIRVSPHALSLVAGASAGQEGLPWDYYLSTFRPDRVLSIDINNDDLVEIPYSVPMPGAEESDEATPLTLTMYRRPTAEGLEYVCAAAVNNADGYMVFYPERWLERVKVVDHPEAGQWRFYEVDERSLEPTVELLRVTVYSMRDYNGQESDENILLATRGAMQYYGYIPASSAESDLAVTPGEVRDALFVLA
ncbi:MAG: hypothetical protein LBV27_11030 [Oscillospiraceae bacterium]|jgi:hypothetical protein|nr:hypothetical protein [Oscillospiraceae bacterium]